MFPKTKIVVLFFSATFVVYGLVGGMWNKVSARDDTYQDLTIFTEVLNKVREDYVEKPDLERAMSGALHGMMEALDPYSSFIDGETYQRIQQSKSELVASPGIVLSKRYGYAHIVSVVPDSPADREGLRSGDLIEAIEGQVTTRMSLWKAKKLLVGEPESSVRIRVIRGRRSEPSQIDLVRENPTFSEVGARVVESGIALLRIPHFHEKVSQVVVSKLKILGSLGMRGLIIDVRGSALGEVQEAVRVSDLFLSKGETILSLRERDGNETKFLSLNEPEVSRVPIVMLVDSGTSGAAEVLVAALRDNQITETVGEKTNGEGSLQEVFHLKDGSVLQISTKLFYRPSGEAIQAQRLRDSGVSPDVRSPSQDFVTNFYFENTDDDLRDNLGESFYRKLKDAVESEQFEEGLRRIRKQLEKKAA